MEAKETPQIEIINSREIRKRLDISEPTLIRWRRKGRIPYLSIGSAIRYDWHKVLEAISSDNKKGASRC